MLFKNKKKQTCWVCQEVKILMLELEDLSTLIDFMSHVLRSSVTQRHKHLTNLSKACVVIKLIQY